MEEYTQTNEELCKTNEEVRKILHRRSTREHSPSLSTKDDPKPFLEQIMDEPMPPYYITPKIALFFGVEDPENHLTTFKAQMIVFGGSDAIQCKMLMGTFTGTTLQWFSGFPYGHITSFP